jgi:type IV pilus assembly protein PilM
MSLAGRLRALVEDPPPAHIFEISAAGIAWWVEGREGFEPLGEGVLHVNPLADNVRDADALAAVVRRLAPANGTPARRRPCAVILPDYAARLAVLDFDSLPGKTEEQASLIRFRMKKTLPFDPDSAAMRFHVQTVGGRQEVVVAAVALEILSRYEAAFRAAALHPGFVTVGALAMLDLPETQSPQTTLIARRNGRVLTLTVLHQNAARLIRCVQIEPEPEEVQGIVGPTAAFVEDEYGAQIERVVACGLEGIGVAWPAAAAVTNLRVPPERAALAGYLHAISH